MSKQGLLAQIEEGCFTRSQHFPLSTSKWPSGLNAWPARTVLASPWGALTYTQQKEKDTKHNEKGCLEAAEARPRVALTRCQKELANDIFDACRLAIGGTKRDFVGSVLWWGDRLLGVQSVNFPTNNWETSIMQSVFQSIHAGVSGAFSAVEPAMLNCGQKHPRWMSPKGMKRWLPRVYYESLSLCERSESWGGGGGQTRKVQVNHVSLLVCLWLANKVMFSGLVMQNMQGEWVLHH